MWQTYIDACTISEVLGLVRKQGESKNCCPAPLIGTRIGKRPRPEVSVLIDISRITGLNTITLDEAGLIHLGPLVTHNQCVGSKLICEAAFPLAQACWEVGSPQIRNRGTIAGNLITASPANDTISPLIALGAKLRLKSISGERIVPLEQFIKAIRFTVCSRTKCWLTSFFRKCRATRRASIKKFALRRAQAISVGNVAIGTYL